MKGRKVFVVRVHSFGSVDLPNGKTTDRTNQTNEWREKKSEIEFKRFFPIHVSNEAHTREKKQQQEHKNSGEKFWRISLTYNTT